MPYQDISKLGQRREPDPKTFSALVAEALAKDPEWIYGSVLPIAKNREDGSYSAALPGFLRDYLSGWADLITGPSVGENLSPQAVLSILGPGATASATSPSMVVGPGARSFNWAKAFRNPIKDADEIARNTINDAEAAIYDREFMLNQDYKLGEFLDHPELFYNYPDLADMNLQFNKTPGLRGTFSANKNAMTLNPDELQTDAQLISTTLHELQHAIQSTEGMSQGSNPFNFLPFNYKSAKKIFDVVSTPEGENKFLKRQLTSDELERVSKGITELNQMRNTAFDLYEKVPGEMESRAVQHKYFNDLVPAPNMFDPAPAMDGILPQNVLLPAPYNFLDLPAAAGHRPNYLRDRQQYSQDLQLTAKLLSELMRK